MYRKPRALLALVASALTVVIAACSAFEGAPADGLDDPDDPRSGGPPSVDDSGVLPERDASAIDGQGADPAADGSVDASAPDAKDGGNAGRTPLCGSAECSGDDVCCVVAAGLVCRSPATCPGPRFDCIDKDDCGGGEVCCSTGPRTFCAKSCNVATERILCRNSADCPSMADCSPVACGDASVVTPAKACTAGAAVFSAGGFSCVYP